MSRFNTMQISEHSHNHLSHHPPKAHTLNPSHHHLRPLAAIGSSSYSAFSPVHQQRLSNAVTMEAVRDLGADGHVSTKEDAQRDPGGNVTLMLQRALLLLFARLWVAVGLPKNAKLLSSGWPVHTTQLGYRLVLGLGHGDTAWWRSATLVKTMALALFWLKFHCRENAPSIQQNSAEMIIVILHNTEMNILQQSVNKEVLHCLPPFIRGNWITICKITNASWSKNIF